jgi:hypothetical protein
MSRELAMKFCGPVLIKETGIPTSPVDRGYTAERQMSFYKELQLRLPPTRMVAFAYFSAFDAPWRVADAHPTPGYHPEEAHFGLYSADRKPKKVLTIIRALSSN